MGKSGNITGSVKAPHIVVGGHVSGPLHSAESIEIQEGACVVGDVFYKAIDIQAGGVLAAILAARGLAGGRAVAAGTAHPNARARGTR